MRAMEEKHKVKETCEQGDLLSPSLKKASVRKVWAARSLDQWERGLLKSGGGVCGPAMEGQGGVVLGFPCSPGIPKAGKKQRVAPPTSRRCLVL